MPREQQLEAPEAGARARRLEAAGGDPQLPPRHRARGDGAVQVEEQDGPRVDPEVAVDLARDDRAGLRRALVVGVEVVAAVAVLLVLVVVVLVERDGVALPAVKLLLLLVKLLLLLLVVVVVVREPVGERARTPAHRDDRGAVGTDHPPAGAKGPGRRRRGKGAARVSVPADERPRCGASGSTQRRRSRS